MTDEGTHRAACRSDNGSVMPSILHLTLLQGESTLNSNPHEAVVIEFKQAENLSSTAVKY